MTWEITCANVMKKQVRHFLNRYGTIERDYQHWERKNHIFVFFDPHGRLTRKDFVEHGVLEAYLQQPVQFDCYD